MKSVPRASVLLALCLRVGGACELQRVSNRQLEQAAAGRAVAGGCCRWRRGDQRCSARPPACFVCNLAGPQQHESYVHAVVPCPYAAMKQVAATCTPKRDGCTSCSVNRKKWEQQPLA